MKTSVHPHLNVAIRAARLAGDIMIQALNHLDSVQIQEKSHNDFVTEIDLKAEAVIIERLHAAFPEDSFLSEEQGEIWHEDRDHIWVIDPIDGTLNFIHGFPYFSISIAKKIKGRVEHGLIYNPISQDLFTASRGEGAMVNDRRMRVSKRTSLKGALVAANMPRATTQAGLYQKVSEKILPEIGALRRTGSSALDLAYVAAGYFDAFICDHFCEWDIAAGALIVQEAGGMVVDFKGGDNMLKEMGLLAANPKLLKPLLVALKDGP